MKELSRKEIWIKNTCQIYLGLMQNTMIQQAVESRKKFSRVLGSFKGTKDLVLKQVARDTDENMFVRSKHHDGHEFL
jgi:hypothetical protein